MGVAQRRDLLAAVVLILAGIGKHGKGVVVAGERRACTQKPRRDAGKRWCDAHGPVSAILFGMAGSEVRPRPSHEIRKYSRLVLASIAAEWGLIVVQAPGRV